MERNSAEFNAKRSRNDWREVRDEQNEFSGTSFADLPSNIVENIVLRLSVNRIAICKCVCKTWKEIISDPGFAKEHFDRSHSFPLISGARMFYLVQEEKVEYMERVLDKCSIKLPHYGCPLCRVNVQLDTKFRVPLLNFENIQNEETSVKWKMKVSNYRVVNSCNGFLCLSKWYDNDPVMVCNPITCEFIYLPEVRTVAYPEPYWRSRHCTSGFGYCRTTNQYKVIRRFLNYGRQLVAEVHVLGTKSWKGIDPSRYSEYNLFPTSLNGFLYWLSENFVTTFDIDKECFGSVSVPLLKTKSPYRDMGMGVLGGELCVTEVDDNDVNVWAMKDNNRGEMVWSKLFSFHEFRKWPSGSLQPIRYLNDRALLMFDSHRNAFIYKDPKKYGWRYIRVRGIDSPMEAIAHRPSFVSLNDVLTGCDVEVLTVNSRCGPLNLDNESNVVSLLEEYHKRA